ncbi:MAG: tetratricopeptide repeat protein [Alphaproteobacteria bacterium]|nr:tetratricopeptide repeat protein [Alphaproteobacteria bacterium]
MIFSILPQGICISHLESVHGIKFTRREIDIIAYLLSGKSAKTIATCLSIAPKTIEAHMRNIMMKVECNSRDGIIEFIEKSKKLPFFKEHYINLLINTSFEEKLSKIAIEVKNEPPSCVIVYWDNREYYDSLCHDLKKHLKLAGIKTSSDMRENQLFFRAPINDRESGKNKFIIYAVPREMIEQEVVNKKGEVISFIQKLRETPNTIIALFSSKNTNNDFLQNFNNTKDVHDLEQETYYDFVFAILKKYLPNINLEPIISDFTKYNRLIGSTSDIVPKQPSQENKLLLNTSLLSYWKTYIEKLFFILKLAKTPLFIISSISIGVFFVYSLAFTSEKKDISTSIKNMTCNVTARSDLSIPTSSVFLDRPYLLEKIDKSLKGQHAIQTIALTGTGGAGKTTLARYYIRQQNANVVWEINAKSEKDLYDSFEGLADSLCKPEEKGKLRDIRDIKDTKDREKKIVLLVRDQLQKLSNWILVFDNVEKFSDLQNYFPHDPSLWGRGKVILITKDNNIKNNNNINKTIQVGELSSEEKRALFTKIMTNGNFSNFTVAQNEQATKFLNDIPPFPLDVSIAAYYLKSTNVPYQTYLEKLTQYDKDFEGIQQTLLEEASAYTKTRYGIITLSLQNIIDTHQDFLDLLLFISLLDSQNIPRELLERHKSSTVVDNFIYNLKKHSLVTNEAILCSDSTPTFSIHRSTQAITLAYLTNLLTSENNKKIIEDIEATFKNYIAEVMDKEDFTKMTLLIRHCEIFLTHPHLLTDLVIASIGSELGNVYRDLGNYEKAKQLFEQSIAFHKKSLNENSLLFAQALGWLGCVYSDQGNYEKAKDLLEQSITIYRKGSYENNSWFGRTLGWLGNVYREQGNYKKAKQLFEESLTVYKNNSYENHPWFAQALGRLGSIYREQCNYEKSKQLLEESLVIYKKNSHENHPWFARALAWLGSVYRDLGHYEKAKQLLEESLVIYKKNSHENHPWFAWTLVWVGGLYKEQGNYEKARQCLEESLEIYKKNSYENHPWFARALVGLGSVHREQGNYEKAGHFFEESLAIYRRNSYENHPWFARTLEHLGDIYREQGNYEKAKRSFEESLAIYKKHHFENHPWFALALARLGSVYKDLGNYTKAKNLLECSYQTYEKTYGKDHVDAAPVVMNLGQVYMLENDIKTAEILINKALEIFQVKKKAESYVCLESLSDLYLKKASQIMNKEESEIFKKQATDYLKQALEVIKAHFPKNSPHVPRIETKIIKLTFS